MHGYVMANSFQEFLDEYTQIGCVGGEDWQWEAFTNNHTTPIDASCENAKKWLEIMITGVDYILYTDKSQDALMEKIKETIPFWGNPYFVIDNEDETTDVYIFRDEEMFQLMEEKGFYADELSGEGPFLLIINKQYSSKLNRITLVLAEEVDESKFSKQVWGWIKSIL